MIRQRCPIMREENSDMPDEADLPNSQPALNPEEPAATPTYSLRDRVRAGIAACVILALPVGYLVAHYGFPKQVSATTQPLVVDNPINLSLGYIRANQPGRALPVLDGVVAADPNNVVAWNNLCVAHTMLMSYNVAIEDCGKALQIQPNFQLAKNNLKWATDELQKTRQSIALEEQTAPASRDADFYLAEGLNFLHTGDYDQAIKAWQRALDLDPRDALAANNIGVAYMSKNQPALAVPWFRKAVEIDPSLQLARNNLAWGEDVASKAAKQY